MLGFLGKLFLRILQLVGLYKPVPTIVQLEVTPSSGIPTLAEGGLRVWAQVIGIPKGKIATLRWWHEDLEFSDTLSAREITLDRAGPVEFTLTYEGKRVATQDVLVLNAPPKVYPPFSPQFGSFEFREAAYFDMRFRKVGCDAAGDPEEWYGARDPNEDPLTFEWHCEDVETGKVYSVFDAGNRKRVNGIAIEHELVVIFFGMDDDKPYFPFNPMACGTCPTTPTTPPTPWVPDKKAEVSCIVRDPWGNEVRRSWIYDWSSKSCS